MLKHINTSYTQKDCVRDKALLYKRKKYLFDEEGRTNQRETEKDRDMMRRRKSFSKEERRQIIFEEEKQKKITLAPINI